MPDIEVVGIESLVDLVATLRGEAVPRGPPGRSRRDVAEEVPDLADVRGHNALDPRARGRRGGRPQPVPAGPAGHGQDDDRPPPPVDPAAAGPRRGDRGHPHPVDRRPARRAPASSPSARSARRTTRSRRRGSSAAPTRPSRARRRSPTAASCSSTSCREFARPSLEALRQPLEDGHVTIVRGQQVMVFPTRFMLVAASNPCPCGLGGTAAASAPRPTSPATAAASPARCWTASTS